MKKIIFFASMGLALVGCGPDKSVEDHRNEQLRRNSAMYDALKGDYTGLVRAEEDGQVMGAMKLNLSSSTKATDPNGGEIAPGSPVLVGSMQFLDENLSSLSAPNIFYDRSTGAYSAQIKVKREADNSREIQINLSGHINGGTIHGRIYALDYPELGGVFVLTKDGRPIADLLREARSGGNRRNTGLSPSMSYVGETSFYTTSFTVPVHVLIQKPIRNEPEDIIDALTPSTPISFSVNYGGPNLSFKFDQANHDRRQRLIKATTEIDFNDSRRKMEMQAECRQSTDFKTLTCAHSNSDTGETARTTATLSTNGRDPVDQPEMIPHKEVLFAGTATMPGQKKPSQIKMNVVRHALSREEEIYDLLFPRSDRELIATILFPNGTQVGFSQTKWEMARHNLHGEEARGTHTAFLTCAGFRFDVTSKPFRCSYWTTRSPRIDIQFQAPKR
jgi:hypothetical protein